MNKPKTVGEAIRHAYPGEGVTDGNGHPPDEPGCVWVEEDNPHAGNCEAQWWWALYKLADANKEEA